MNLQRAAGRDGLPHRFHRDSAGAPIQSCEYTRQVFARQNCETRVHRNVGSRHSVWLEHLAKGTCRTSAVHLNRNMVVALTF